MRVMPDPSQGHTTEGARELQRRHGQGPLANRYRRSLPRIPLLPEIPQLPFFRRHDTHGLVRQIDSCRLSQARKTGVPGNLIDSQLGAESVEVHIAGMNDPVVQRDGAVAGLDPASLIAAIKADAAGTVDGE